MPDPSRLLEISPTLGKGRVLVVGDLMLDRYVAGTVDRVSPEAPVPVMRVDRETEMPGGAGNVARNVASLGGRAALVGLIGGDAAGARLTELLAVEERLTLHPVACPDAPTTVKTRYLASGQQLLRADVEGAAAPPPDVLSRIVDRAVAELPGADVAVLSDYAKGVLSAGVVAEIVAAAASAGVPVIVDPKSPDLARYRGAFLVSPNRDELSRATGTAIEDDRSAAAAAGKAVTEAGVGAVLVTRGAQGMTLVVAGEAPLHLRTRARQVFDVSGAGDTAVATVAAALAAGHGLEEAAALANVCAGIVVGKVGTATVDAGELAAALRAGAPPDPEGPGGKIVSRRAACDRIAGWRRRDKRVAFTNGCFDLIHPGHVSLLEQARAAGDALIVGLNSDASARRLKGAGRPVQTAAARASVLAGLSAVDLVVEFGEDTPLSLIEAIRPDVLVKGADYAEEDVVGGDLVKSYGGRVVLAGLAEGHSTSGTIGRIERRAGGGA